MIKNLRKIVLMGSLILAGGIYTGGNFENSSGKKNEYSDKLNNFLNKQSEIYVASDLEKALKREREEFSKPLHITPDLLNIYIKQAYEEMKKEGKGWPNEFDKRLFRLMLKQESGYDAHAVSKTGYMGLGQVGFSLVETLRPDKWNNEFRDSITGEIDSLAVRKYLFNPVENIKLSLEGLEYMTKFCKRYDSNWKQSDLEPKRKKVLFCYNAGVGTAKENNFNWTNKELPKENRKYPELIMKAYHNPKVKVKL